MAYKNHIVYLFVCYAIICFCCIKWFVVVVKCCENFVKILCLLLFVLFCAVVCVVLCTTKLLY